MSFLSTRALGVVASTVPANGDVNPYGVAVSTKSFAKIHAGDILVSNFNNSANLQGRGTTIVDITPGAEPRRSLPQSIRSRGTRHWPHRSRGEPGWHTLLRR